MTRTNYANGTHLTTSGHWDVFTSGAAMCPDGKVRALKRIAITADTFFSIPAAVRVKGRTVSGFVTVKDTSDPNGNGALNDPECTVVFTATGKNAGVMAEAKMMQESRVFYVAYFDGGFPGQTSSDPTRHASIQACVAAFETYARETGRFYYDAYGTANAAVYACDSDESWAEAQRFAGVGCPFDYPSFTLAIGKRGGIVREVA